MLTLIENNQILSLHYNIHNVITPCRLISSILKVTTYLIVNEIETMAIYKHGFSSALGYWTFCKNNHKIDTHLSWSTWSTISNHSWTHIIHIILVDYRCTGNKWCQLYQYLISFDIENIPNSCATAYWSVLYLIPLLSCLGNFPKMIDWSTREAVAVKCDVTSVF